MATIKKGSYRFNDTLQVPSQYLPVQLSIPCSVSPTYSYDGETLTVNEGESYLISLIDFRNDNGLLVSYSIPSLNSLSHVYNDVYGWDYVSNVMQELGVSNYDVASSWGQVITVTEDTPVDDLVYQLWDLNTEPVEVTAKKFTRLYIGDVAYSSGGKCFKRLTTEEPIIVESYLTFSSPSSFTLATSNTAKNWDGTLEYSTDTSTWNTWDGTTTLSADSGKLYLRGKGNTHISSLTIFPTYWCLSGTAIACEGNIENLLDYATVAKGFHPTMTESCYGSMFKGCTSLITAPELPATQLTKFCYSSMFEGCTSLITAPSLPATTLATYCYMSMFLNCESLLTLPILTALEFPDSCCNRMFFGCDKIKLSRTQTGEYQTAYRIPASGTGTEGQNAFLYMFSYTGGTAALTPSINTTYYTSNTVV